MIYPGHTAEISLPCERRRLYALRTLTINWDREARSQDVAGPRRVTRSMSQAAQFEQGGTSRAAGRYEEEGDEASSMDISRSTERPQQHTPRVRTPRPSTRARGRRSQGSEMDQLINDMGDTQVEQDATLSMAQQNTQLLQAIQDEEAQRWAGWFQYYPPPQ